MKTYLGVDLAGDQGNTGVAEILDTAEGLFYRFPNESWQGHAGLEHLEVHFRTAEKTAVDQPFAYPVGCMRWLMGQTDPADAGNDAYLWRRTDVAMAERVTNLGLRRSTVLPTTRCSNVWRAVALADLLGVPRDVVCGARGRLFETHPRVAWALVVASLRDRETAEELVGDYNGAGPDDRESRNRQREHREKMLRLLADGTGLRPRPDSQKDLASKNGDNLDALICAFVAYLSAHAGAERCLPAHVPEEIVLLEGAAMVPTSDWQARLLMKKS
jgi:hypothetical protein